MNHTRKKLEYLTEEDSRYREDEHNIMFFFEQQESDLVNEFAVCVRFNKNASKRNSKEELEEKGWCAAEIIAGLS